MGAYKFEASGPATPVLIEIPTVRFYADFTRTAAPPPLYVSDLDPEEQNSRLLQHRIALEAQLQQEIKELPGLARDVGDLAPTEATMDTCRRVATSVLAATGYDERIHVAIFNEGDASIDLAFQILRKRRVDLMISADGKGVDEARIDKDLRISHVAHSTHDLDWTSETARWLTAL